MPNDSRDRYGSDPTLYDELDHKLKLAAGVPPLPPAGMPQEPSWYLRRTQAPAARPPDAVGNIRLDWDSYVQSPSRPRTADGSENRGRTIGDRLGDLGKAAQYGLAETMEGFSRSAHHLGVPGLADRLRDAVDFPEGYDATSGIDRTIDSGDAWGVLNSMAEETPHLVVDAARRAPGLLGRAAGVAAPVIDALQDFGHIVDEREKNNGHRPADLADKIAAMTAASAGAVGGQAASMIDVVPFPRLAKPLLARHLANYFAGGAASEAIRELARQVGGSIATEKGLAVDPERLIRSAATGAVSPRRAD